jgi:DNA repair photolyase
MKVTEIECKTALSKSSLPGLSYSLNPYRGCQHQCVYCYAPSVLRIPRDQWETTLEVKVNIPRILEKEVLTKQPGIVGISTVTDPYQPLEQKYRLTHGCLEQLLQYGFPAHIQTKSALVTRDLDLLARFSDSQVMMSIGTLNDNERRVLEPYSSSIQQRLDAVRTFADAGIRTAVFFGPIYPTITEEDVPIILEHLKDAGVMEIWIDRLNLKPGIWENIQKNVRQHTEMATMFTQQVFENTRYYANIQEAIRKRGRERNLKIIDAF